MINKHATKKHINKKTHAIIQERCAILQKVVDLDSDEIIQEKSFNDLQIELVPFSNRRVGLSIVFDGTVKIKYVRQRVNLKYYHKAVFKSIYSDDT